MPVRSYLALALLALLSLVPERLLAHTGLKRSRPAAGDTLRISPTEIRFWFTERVQLSITSARLISSGGRETPLSLVADSADPTSVFAPVTTALTPGTYTVAWQTGGRDGHPVRGTFRFVIAAPTDSAAMANVPGGGAFNVLLDSMMRENADQPSAPLILDREGGEGLSEYRVARWAEFVALLATLGAIAFHFIVAASVGRRGHAALARDVSDAARQLALGSLLLLLVAGCARLFGESMALRPGGSSDPLSLSWLRIVSTTTLWGRGWLFGIFGAIVALLGFALARRSRAGWVLAMIGAVSMAVSPALTGHAIASTRLATVSVLSDVVHVIGGGVWLGTLLLVLIAGLPAVRRRPEEERGVLASALIESFNPIARLGVLLIILSGLISSWLRVGSIDALTHSTYGSLLLYKVFFFLFAAMIGLYNWKKLLPGIAKGSGVARLRRSATLELIVGAVVLAITAALVATEPPADRRNSDVPTTAIQSGVTR